MTSGFLVLLVERMRVPPAQHGTEGGGWRTGGPEAETGIPRDTCNPWVIRGWPWSGALGKGDKICKTCSRAVAKA